MADPEQQLQNVLSTCSTVKELKASFQDVKQHRYVFEMGPEQTSTNFTNSHLSHPECFAAPPITLTSVEARVAIALHYIGRNLAGHPGIVHGGVIATIIDECSGQAAKTHFQNLHEKSNNDADFDPRKGVLAVTAQLTVDFKAPLRTGTVVVTRASINDEQSSARKAAVTTQMWQVDEKSPDQLALVAGGGGLFIRPRAQV